MPLTWESERTGIENNWYALTGRVVAVKVEADDDLHIAIQGATGDKPGIVICEGPAGPQWCQISSENVQFCAATRFSFDGSRFRGVLFRDAFSGARGGKRGPAATRSPESFPLPLADPRAPSIVSKRNEPALAHKCVNLCAKRRRFRRPKIIVDHDPAAIVKQVTGTVQIRVHVIVRVENKQANRAAGQALMNLGDDCRIRGASVNQGNVFCYAEPREVLFEILNDVPAR